MGIYLAGEVIRRNRESMGITQEELCDGICSVETLSRIENGKNTPSRANFEALMGRMGKEGKKYLPFLKSREMEVFLLTEEVELFFSVHDYQGMKQKLTELEQRLDMTEPVNRQYIIRMQAMVEGRLGCISAKERRKMLEEALSCTIPDFSEEVLKKGMLNEQEIKILCNIAMAYMDEEEYEQSIDILTKLYKYLETVHMANITGVMRLILANLGHVLGRAQEFEKSQKVRKKAIKLAKEEGNAGSLASILYGMAYNNEKLHQKESVCLEQLQQAYVLAKCTDNQYMVKHIQKHIIEVYGKEKWEIINCRLEYHH